MIGAMIGSWAGPAPGTAATAPEAVPVERLHEALEEAAGAGGDAASRFERLLPVVTEVFDFATMSRVAVGSAWAEWTPAERLSLRQHFAAYAAANYADNFDDASDITFRTVGVEAADGPRVRVRTELVRPEEDPIAFDYTVQRGDDGPRIVNVVVDGTMNELARRRAEFRVLLDDGGLDNLLDRLAAVTRDRTD